MKVAGIGFSQASHSPKRPVVEAGVLRWTLPTSLAVVSGNGKHSGVSKKCSTRLAARTGSQPSALLFGRTCELVIRTGLTGRPPRREIVVGRQTSCPNGGSRRTTLAGTHLCGSAHSNGAIQGLSWRTSEGEFTKAVRHEAALPGVVLVSGADLQISTVGTQLTAPAVERFSRQRLASMVPAKPGSKKRMLKEDEPDQHSEPLAASLFFLADIFDHVNLGLFGSRWP